MDSDDENALFNIAISDASEDEAPAKDRTAQSEEAFQAIKREYRPKVEDGDIAKHIKLPLPPNAPKMQIQEVIHAVEELYFFRKYEDAAAFARQVLDGSQGLDDDTRRLLTSYESRCRKKITITS